MVLICLIVFVLYGCNRSSQTLNENSRIISLLTKIHQEWNKPVQPGYIRSLDEIEPSTIIKCVELLDEQTYLDATIGFCTYVPLSKHESQFKSAILKLTHSKDERIRGWTVQALGSKTFQPNEYKAALDRLSKDKSRFVRESVKLSGAK